MNAKYITRRRGEGRRVIALWSLRQRCAKVSSGIKDPRSHVSALGKLASPNAEAGTGNFMFGFPVWR